MRCVVQRVKEASVTVAGETVGKIGPGYMVLIGVSVEDTEKDVRYMADKVPNLRIFEDAEDSVKTSSTTTNKAPPKERYSKQARKGRLKL